MPERIYNVNPDGGLEPMVEQPFVREDDLQELLAKYPDLLDGEQVRPDSPRRWVLISREMGIAERPDESSRWSLDHLIVDQDAVPTLVEVKRSSNTEIRRTVVGQMLDYAAHAVDTWTMERMRDAFEQSCQGRSVDASAALAELLQVEEQLDAEIFWQQVAINLKARRMRLLFVADEIPDPLLRVVEFLNQQMPAVEVLAVEIKQYSGTERRTLVPRVLGRTAGAPPPKPVTPRTHLNRQSLLDAFTDAADREVADRLLGIAADVGATLNWGVTSVSIRAKCPLWNQNQITIAILTPPDSFGGWAGEWLTNVYVGVGVDAYIPPHAEAIRPVLDRYVSAFEHDTFMTRDDKKYRRGWTAPYADCAPHLGTIRERVAAVVQELGALQ